MDKKTPLSAGRISYYLLQHRIVQNVDELMTFCDQLKERLNQASDTRCQLAEAVVEGALS